MDNDIKEIMNIGDNLMFDVKGNAPVGLGLISGGLDSLIACLVLKLQNIEVVGKNVLSSKRRRLLRGN